MRSFESGALRWCSEQLRARLTDEGAWKGSAAMNKVPITKEEIELLIVGDLRSFPGCEGAKGVVVVPLPSLSKATWTVSCFNPGNSDCDICDRALQHIVPHFQRAYDLFSKH